MPRKQHRHYIKSSDSFLLRKLRTAVDEFGIAHSRLIAVGSQEIADYKNSSFKTLIEERGIPERFDGDISAAKEEFNTYVDEHLHEPDFIKDIFGSCTRKKELYKYLFNYMNKYLTLETLLQVAHKRGVEADFITVVEVPKDNLETSAA